MVPVTQYRVTVVSNRSRSDAAEVVGPGAPLLEDPRSQASGRVSEPVAQRLGLGRLDRLVAVFGSNPRGKTLAVKALRLAEGTGVRTGVGRYLGCAEV